MINVGTIAPAQGTHTHTHAFPHSKNEKWLSLTLPLPVVSHHIPKYWTEKRRWNEPTRTHWVHSLRIFIKSYNCNTHTHTHVHRPRPHVLTVLLNCENKPFFLFIHSTVSLISGQRPISESETELRIFHSLCSRSWKKTLIRIRLLIIYQFVVYIHSMNLSSENV